MTINNLNPKKIQFHVEHGKYVKCDIVTEDNTKGTGVSICSTLDKQEFEVYRGKRKAAGRAIKALVNKMSSARMRSEYDEFPDHWTKAQMKQVMQYAKEFEYLSRFDSE